MFYRFRYHVDLISYPVKVKKSIIHVFCGIKRFGIDRYGMAGRVDAKEYRLKTIMPIAVARKELPKELTSYDLLKSLAVVLMVIDHVGFFFFPEEMWFRTLGRLCLPIWFFLIGYAKSDDVPKSIWIGGAVVSISSLVSGPFFLPLNILFTIAFMRKCRNWVVNSALSSSQALKGMFFILFLFSFPSAVFVEYGTLAMLIALVGFIARRKEFVYKQIGRKSTLMYVVAAFFVTYVMVGVQMPYLTGGQTLVLTCGYALLGVVLWNFKPLVFSDARKYMAGSFIALFQFMGRWSLEIYVVHIVIFRAVAMIVAPERFPLWGWHVVDPAVISLFVMGGGAQ